MNLPRLLRVASRWQSTATKRPKRFYNDASVVDVEDAAGGGHVFEVRLDKRTLRTQAGNVLRVRSRPLALAIAQEWKSQKEVLNVSDMRLTGLAFTAIDNPLHRTEDDIVTKVLEHLETDTVLYMATEPARLVEQQKLGWTPLIEWINREHSLDLQPSKTAKVSEMSRERLRRDLSVYNLWSLIGLEYAVESIKSVIITLATIAHKIEVDKAVGLATLEHNFQREIWGNIPWAHDVERMELHSRLSAAVLFVHFTANLHTETYSQKK